MKRYLFIICMFISSLCIWAEDNTSSVSTSQTGGRYEIIQSNIMRSHFFKLDKYTGDVYQYVKKSDNNFTWQKIDIIGKHVSEESSSINYQLFIGGIAVADVILINIHTGVTYNLYRDSKEDTLFFARIYEF